MWFICIVVRDYGLRSVYTACAQAATHHSSLSNSAFQLKPPRRCSILANTNNRMFLAHGNHARIRPHRPFYMNANMTPSNTLCHWQVCSAGVRTQIGRGLPRVCMFDWVVIGRCDCFMCVLWWPSYALQMLLATGTCIMHDGGSTWGAHVYAMGTC